MVVSDLKFMKEVIDNHLMQHYNKLEQPLTGPEQLRKDLVEMVVQKIISRHNV